MSRFWQSESTAARRRFDVYLVDATDGLTPETGEAAGQPQISKNGGAWANTTATLTAVGNGAYYVELTATELDTLGGIQVRYKSANTAEFNGIARVELQPLSPTVAGRTLDVNSTGEAGIDWANVGGKTSTVALTNTTVGTVSLIAPAGITSSSFNTGAITSSSFASGAINNAATAAGFIGATSFAAGAIDAAAIAPDAIGSSELAASAVAEIADAVWDEILTSGHSIANSASVILQAASAPSAAAVADAVWDEVMAGHLTAGTTGAILNAASAPTAAAVADAVWDEVLSGHLTAGSTGAALNDAGGSSGLTVQNIVDGVWDAVASDYNTAGTMGANLQSLADAALIWPTPVGGGTTASNIIRRAMAIADVHDNFVSEAEWLDWLNKENKALTLFLARAGWTLPFDTTIATITSSGWDLATDGASAVSVARTAAGHYVFTPTLADVMALVSIHEIRSGELRRLTFNDSVSFLRQSINGANTTGHATDYRLRMYGNEIHADFYPTPVVAESYLLTYLSAPVPITATTQSVALPMGWEERLVLGMARAALIKEESDYSAVEKLMREMDSQIEQLCWSRVMSEAPRVRNTDPNVAIPDWRLWYWL